MTDQTLRHASAAPPTTVTFRDRSFESYAIGDVETYRKTIENADVLAFASMSGDTYPLHVDDAYAATTRFGQRIAHGMLSASLLSTVNAMLLGLPGGIYVEQSVRFRRPVMIGDTLTARSEVVEIIADKRRVRTACTIVNQRGKLVIDGTAVIQKD